jgi:sigma-B regulation protein RsbU (phosphoserine phosphatase)
VAASLIVEVPGEAPFEVCLDLATVVVGRQGCELALRDMNVSRRHFRIERAAAGYHVLKDEGSRNGTVVNGVSVLEKVLQDGDRIHVGGSTLLFRQVASPTALPLELAPRPVAGGARSGVHRLSAGPEPTLAQAPARRVTAPMPPAAPAASSAASAPLADGFGLTPAPGPVPALPEPVRPPTRVVGPPLPDTFGPAPAAAPATALYEGDPGTRPHLLPRSSRPEVPTPPGGERWRKLAEVACAINVEHEIDRLLERILDAVLSLVPAKGGFLVLCEGEALTIRATRNAPTTALDQAEGTWRISQQVCREAVAQRRPVLTQDALGDERLGQFQSVLSLHLRSILCVPFSSMDEVLGVVYLDEPQVDPFADDGEVVELVGAFGDLAGIALANARLLAETAARERLEEELRIAARIQRKLLPAAPPQVRGLELAGRTLPARAVGGDVFDFFRRATPEPEVLISIGDVAGKGVGAGIVMSTVRALVRAYAESLGPTDELLAHVNRALSVDLEPGTFVSFLLIRYAEDTGRLSFTGAGHEHLILYRASTRQVECLRAGGVVLGLSPDVRDRLAERHMTLQPGDVVCLYTDGATEATSPEGEEFGLERVVAAVQAGPLDPEAIVERLMEAVVEFSGRDRPLHDDLTVVALRKA